jgi:hypothetical protein
MLLNKVVTPYAAGCLAIARNRIWTDTHIEGRYIIEQTHHGKIVRWIKKPNPRGTFLTGLRYAEWDRGPVLIYNYGTWYEGDPNENSVGVLFLSDLRHKVVKYDCPAALRRGGTTWTPYGMAVGFGGYYERAEDMQISWGPSLVLEDGRQLIGYQKDRCTRPETYHAEDWLGDGKTWSAADVIGGSKGAGGAVWLAGGPVFFARIGIGNISYTDGGIVSEGTSDIALIYKEVGETIEGPWIVEHDYGDVRGVSLWDDALYGFISGEEPVIKRIDL